MKKILVILDGIVAKRLLERIVESNTGENNYDIVYMYDQIVPKTKPSNCTFYKFDPTSESKLNLVLDKEVHTNILLSMGSKDETISVIKNIRKKNPTIQISVLDYWGTDFKEDPYLQVHRGIEVLANGMIEKLPNTPVTAQNIGLRQGEIMEIRIPFGSSYAYRYVGSIEQKDWKIFGLYRNQQLLNMKPSLVLKPNDIILVIGRPEVLMQVYNAIRKTQGQFPMPFGPNIYLYLDLHQHSEEEAISAVVEAKFLNHKLKNKCLIIRVTRPTTPSTMSKIKEEIKDLENIALEIDYHNRGFIKTINADLKKQHIGMIILSHKMFKDTTVLYKLAELKIPIFKLGIQHIESIKETLVLLNDKKSYEQISPIIFDVSSQLKVRTKIYNLEPIDEAKNNDDILEHFKNLGKIYNQKLEIISDEKNPIRELKKLENILQILPLKKQMMRKRFLPEFFYTDSDVISFDIHEYNQLLVPIIDN